MKKKKIFILVGHPDKESLSANLATSYAYAAEEAEHEVRRTNLGELQFDPILHRGYKEVQPLEPHLLKIQEDILWAEHFVLIYPTWWSTMPALLKGMFDRIWLPQFAFQFYGTGIFKELLWRRLLKGRSARVFVLSDAPPVFARFIFGDSTNEIRRGILWFAGFSVRVKKIGSLKFVTDREVETWKRKFHKWGTRAF